MKRSLCDTNSPNAGVKKSHHFVVNKELKQSIEPIYLEMGGGNINEVIKKLIIAGISVFKEQGLTNFNQFVLNRK